jgi:hypothetical protein
MTVNSDAISSSFGPDYAMLVSARSVRSGRYSNYNFSCVKTSSSSPVQYLWQTDTHKQVRDRALIMCPRSHLYSTFNFFKIVCIKTIGIRLANLYAKFDEFARLSAIHGTRQKLKPIKQGQHIYVQVEHCIITWNILYKIIML